MKRIKFYLPLVAIIFSMLACSLPWETPPQVPTELPPVTEITAEPTDEAPPEVVTEPPYTCLPDQVAAAAFGVTFCYPGSVFTGFEQAFPPEVPKDPNMAPWEYNPTMIELNFTGYPVHNEYHQPRIQIYPIADYVALEPNLAESFDFLKTMLDTEDANPGGIPFVPIFNAAQMMQGQIRYLDFRNGQGVRFITQYGQAFSPINNVSAFYAFMGLTQDGKYVISATFPLRHPDWAADNMTDPVEGWDTFLANYEFYISEMEIFLDSQPPEQFTPNLTLLDQMMASLLVPPEAIP